MEEELIKKITETLLAGGKMLGVHCGRCKSPLFELRGKIVCPICGEVQEDEKKEPREHAGSLEKLEKALYSKLEALIQQLEEEKDISKTPQLLESIRATLETLERVKKK